MSPFSLILKDIYVLVKLIDFIYHKENLWSIMLDYRGLEALFTVIELQSFEGAASKLHITQSAVSQRIKALEVHYGEPILIRTLPYAPTKLGGHLLGHFKQISILEGSLENKIRPTRTKPHLSIALNRDSLETWFMELIEKEDILKNINLEIITDDQELTLDYLKKGLVSACVSTSSKEIVGGKAAFLGNMEYLLVASPAFKKKYFSKGDIKKSLLNAPALKYDKNDHLHERYLEKFYDLNPQELNFQIIPSVRGFKTYALSGFGYGLLPKIDVTEELKTKKLIQLSAKTWKVSLYWHFWSISLEYYKKFNNELIKFGNLCLSAKN